MQYRIGDMRLDALLAVAVQVFRDHGRTLLAATVALTLPFFLAYYLVVYDHVFSRLNILLGREIFSWRVGYWIGYFICLALWYATWLVLSAALSFIAASRTIGIPVSARDGWRRCKECAWELAKTGLLILPLVATFYTLWGVLLGGALIAAVSGGPEENIATLTVLYFIGFAVLGYLAWLLVRYLFVFKLVVLERVSGLEALRRCRLLMRGFYGKGFALWGVYTAATMAIGYAMGFVASLYVAWFISAAINYAIYAFFTTATTMLYLASRSRHEGLDQRITAARSGV